MTKPQRVFGLILAAATPLSILLGLVAVHIAPNTILPYVFVYMWLALSVLLSVYVVAIVDVDRP